MVDYLSHFMASVEHKQEGFFLNYRIKEIQSILFTFYRKRPTENSNFCLHP